MNLTTKADVKGPVFGTFLMIIFTAVWGLIAENALNNRDHRILGIVLSVILIIFIFFYIKSLGFLKSLPAQTEKVNDEEEKKRKKQFLIIGTIEGLSIFIINTVLLNLKLEQYFISSMALIVGLHFFPLAKLFKNKFHYYIGMWTTLIALIGFVLTYQEITSTNLITAFVSTGCAISTILMGAKLIMVVNSKRNSI